MGPHLSVHMKCETEMLYLLHPLLTPTFYLNAYNTFLDSELVKLPFLLSNRAWAKLYALPSFIVHTALLMYL